MMLAYLDISQIAYEHRAEKRWEFLFKGTPTDFTYPSPLPPMMHQRIAVEASCGMEGFAYFQEMGTGKSKQVVDEALLYELKHSSPQRVLIVCPKSLRYNWAEEIRTNIPPFFAYAVQLLNDPESIIDLMQAPQHLKFLIASYDLMASYIDLLGIFQPTLCALDEVHYIKTPTSQRTRAAFKLRDFCDKRRILTGTYCANTIMDLWAPCQFLRDGILGYATYTGFKSAFAKVRNIIDPITGQPTPFDKIVGYKDVDRLKESMSRFSFIVRKDQCMDLPERTYETIAIDMPPTMRAQYDELEKNMVLELGLGFQVQTEFILPWLTRLAQMCCGFVGSTHTENDIVTKEVSVIEGGDTKARAMVEDIRQVAQECKFIVWARFNYDIDLIVRLLNEAGIRHVVYDGRVSEEDRNANVQVFNKDPQVRGFVGKASAGGVGLNLIGDQSSQYTSCCAMYFHSNSRNFAHRDQAEARNHRKGSTRPVIYKDYVYKDSVDEENLFDCKNKAAVQGMMKDMSTIERILLRQGKHHDTAGANGVGASDT